MNTMSNERNSKRKARKTSPKKRMAEYRKSASHDNDTGAAIYPVHMPAIAQEHIPCQLAM